MNVIHSCLCCLRCPPHKDLTTPYTRLGQTEIYADMLKQCFDLHLVVGDDGPAGICCTCVGRLRDASDFKLQVQRSQAELQARLQGESPVKEEEPAVGPDKQNGDEVSEELVSYEKPLVKPEILDEDGTPDEILYDMLRLNMAARDEGKPLPQEDPAVAPGTQDGDGTSEEPVSQGPPVKLEMLDDMLHEELIFKPEMADEDETSDEMSLRADGYAVHARQQLAMACSVVLERLPIDAAVHSGGKPYCCDHCGKRFTYKSFLSKHMQDTHILSVPLFNSNNKTFSCDFCSSTFQTKLLVTEHEKIEHGVTNFMCAECEYITVYKKSLETHMKSHGVVNNLNYRRKRLKCYNSDYMCSFSSDLRNPEMTNTGDKPFQCSYCDYKCKHKSNLQRHHMIHTGTKPYKCSYCNYKCSHRSVLRTHLRKHTGDKPYKCSHCDYKSSQISCLRQHEKTHTKPFQCSSCHYKCSRKAHLERHQLIHTTARPFKCSHCDYTCRQKTDLQRHIRIHTGEKPYNCNHCDFKSRLSSAVRRHELTHTGETPFHCSYCNYKCTQKVHLQRHQMVHTGVKPFKCDSCDYTCKHKHNLKAHLITHTRSKPYKSTVIRKGPTKQIYEDI